MKWQWALFLSALVAGRVPAQESPPTAAAPVPSGLPEPYVGLQSALAPPQFPSAGADPLAAPVHVTSCDDCSPVGRNRRDRLSGTHDFPNFINSRAVTAIYPIFGSSWISNSTHPYRSARLICGK